MEMSSKSLNKTSNVNAKTVDNCARYQKIAPETVRHSPSSTVVTIQETAILNGNGRMRNRKGQRHSHTKSRTGCFNCKKRRIKCRENRPSCTQCAKRRLQCQWPDLQIHDTRAAVKIDFSGPSMPAQIQSAESAFSMQDFRFFYHFIEKAYPHHPIGNDAVWTHEIPSISHNYDYLMHAMLGLSASDLTAKGKQTSDLILSAMSHRVQAIKSLNGALLNGLNTFEEGNAMLATCYVLLFQSIHLDDGLSEYMFFIRGCVLIAQDMGCKRMKFLFHSLLGLGSLAQMDSSIKEYPEFRLEPVNAGCKSLQAFEHLCKKNYEKNFHHTLLKTARALYTSSRTAYLGLREIYGGFSYMMSHEDFQHFIDPANEVGQLLQAHLVAVHLLLTPITVHQLRERKPEIPSSESVRWLGAIFRRITPRMLQFFEWPMSVAESIRTGSFFASLLVESPSILQEDENMEEGDGT